MTAARPLKVYDLAHCRAGDKGNTSNISVIAFRDDDYALLCEHVTVARVKEHFREIVVGDVIRYELPAISALNFVLKGALGGGVTRSLALDAHGKGLSSALLNLELRVQAR